MLKKFKRIAAAALSAAMILTCTGCTIGKSTAYALTVDGYQIKAGVYIYYSYTAFTEAKNTAADQNENLNVEDDDAVKKVKIDGKNFLDYVKDKTTESCISHVAVIKHFDELGLSLSESELDEIDETVEAAWNDSSNKKMMESNGISRESFKEIITTSYKKEAVFQSFYGEGGSENITEDQLRDYYTENTARVKYVDMDLHDADGNDLDEAGKKEIMDMAEDFLARAKAANNETAMLQEFNVFQEEYDNYVSEQAAEAAGDDESTTEAPTEAPTEATESVTETTAQTSANDDKSTDSVGDSTSGTDSDSSSSNNDTALTTAPESDSEEETTTTTTSPYANEMTISVVTTEEGTSEDDVTYTPSKVCYDWIFNDSEIGVPEIVEDEDTVYVIVRLDITERMTDDDLWSETAVDNTRYIMFNDDMEDQITDWGKSYEVVKNDRAYKRYDPFNIDDSTDSQ